jgi:hypothetical protein
MDNLKAYLAEHAGREEDFLSTHSLDDPSYSVEVHLTLAMFNKLDELSKARGRDIPEFIMDVVASNIHRYQA